MEGSTGVKPKRFSLLSERHLKEEWDVEGLRKLMENRDIPKLKDVLNEYPELANGKSRFRSTILSEVVEKNDIAVLEVFLDTKGIDLFQRDYGSTVYHTSPLKMLEVLVEKYFLGIHVLDKYGKSPLHLACKESDMEKVRFLLEQPTINVHIMDTDEKFPIDYCSDENIKGMITDHMGKVDIQEQEKVEKEALSGITAVEDLSDKEWSFNDIWEMLVLKEFGKLKSIFQAKPELINLKSEEEQNTLLHTAIIHRYSSNVINFLIRLGIDITLMNERGQTAYHIATKTMHDIKKLVKLHPAGLNTLDRDWNTPLHLICQNEELEMLAFVLQYPDIRTDVINEKGRTAAETTDHKSIHYMLKMYANTECQGFVSSVEQVEKEIKKVDEDERAKKLNERKEELARKHNEQSMNKKETDEKQRYSILTEDDLNQTWDFYDLEELLKNRDYPKLKDIFNKNPDLINLTKYGEGFLQVAVSVNSIDILKFLVEYGLDLSLRNKSEMTSLESSIGCPEIFKFVLDEKPEQLKSFDVLQRICESRKEYAEELEIVLEKNIIPINVLSDRWNTPLHMACSMEHTKIVELLLKQPDIDVNVKNRDDGYLPEQLSKYDSAIREMVTAHRESGLSIDEILDTERESYSYLSERDFEDEHTFRIVVNNKDYRKLKDLIKFKPEVVFDSKIYRGDLIQYGLVIDRSGEPVLDGLKIVCRKENQRFLTIFAEHDSLGKLYIHHPCHVALWKDWYEMIPFGIIGLGSLQTPLHNACMKDFLEGVELLLNQPGINVDIMNEDLKFADELTTDDNIKALIQKQRQIKRQKGDGVALSGVRSDQIIGDEVKNQCSFYELLRLLAERNEEMLTNLFEADPEMANKQNANGYTLLHFAISMGLSESVKFLLNFGFDCKSRVSNGYSAFHMAVRFKEIFALLLEHDATGLNHPDRKWNTPLYYACRFGDVESVEYLLQQENIRVDSMNKRGQTVNDIAEDENVRKLLNKFLMKDVTQEEV